MASTSLFGQVVPLPRGPHGLSREEVRSSQLARLLTATADLVAEHGYAGTTITAIARRAGVSPNVFYEHFPDKESCFMTAYEAFATALLADVEAVVPAATTWDDFVTGVLEAYLGLLEREPSAARAFLVEIEAAGPAARTRRREIYAAAAAIIKHQHELVRRADPSLAALPEPAYLGFVHAVRELACDAIEHDPPLRLRALVPELASWTLRLRGERRRHDVKMDELAVLPFSSQKAWRSWIKRNQATAPGVWIKIAKAASGIATVTHAEALDVALCYGWIDGTRRALDAQYFLQRFSPRTSRSKWSQINCAKAEGLIESGDMQPAGLREVERAKADGRWDAAYAPQSTAVVPADLQRELDAHPVARAFFATLDSRNRYAVLFRLHEAKKPETRARRLEKFVAMLDAHETLHP